MFDMIASRLRFALSALLVLFVATTASAQITTGSIGGTVRDTSGNPVAEVQILVTNTTTGFKTATITRANGRYVVPNLDVGPGYTVTARRIGFGPITRDGFSVSLGQMAGIDFALKTQAAQLTAVTVTSTADNTFTSSRTGAETTINGGQLSRIATLGRDVTQAVKFVPQVQNNTTGGPSAGGAYNRYNNYTIDGANQNDRFNLNSSGGVPGSATNGRLISLDAVKEFQVLMAPADVRQGNFAGMAVNMITKNGTNTWTGGASYTYRDPQFASPEQFIKDGKLKVSQFGFYLGGPIIKDRLHIFIAPDFQQRTSPAAGTYIGASANDAGLVFADTITRIITAMKAKGADVGDGGKVSINNPLQNLSARLDFLVNDNNRLVFRQLYNTAKNTSFSRSNSAYNANPTVQSTGFRFTSNGFNSQNTNYSSTLHLYSAFSGGKTNELFAGYNTIKDERLLDGQLLPEMSLPVTRTSGGTIAATFGSEQFSPGNALKENIVEIADNFSIPKGDHTYLLGGRYERTYIYNNFPQQALGVWKFPSMTALEAGTPNGYAVGYINGGAGAAVFTVQQMSLYAQDKWEVSPRLTLTYGLRADMPNFLDKPPRNDSVMAQFTKAGLTPIRTDATPKTQILWSPRLGFNWDPTGDRQNQVRGTLGIFTAPPPFILIGNPYSTSGLGYVSLSCTNAATPAFTIDVTKLPKSCAGQPEPAPGLAGTTVINATDPNFKYPQYAVGSLGFDRQLPFNTTFTFEALYRKAINGVMIVDANLKGPRTVNGKPYTDLNGRTLYADTISATGAVTNSGQKVINFIGSPAVAFSQGLYYVTNQRKDYNYTLTGQLKKKFDNDLEVTLAYTYMQSKDVQSLTSDRAVSNFQNGRNYEGLQTDDTPTTSAFERPHRIMMFGSYTMPWKTTDLTWYYEAQSGFPITYHVTGGDLNGDGINTNDAIYLPTGLADANRWKFAASGTITAAAQEAAFDQFISANKCLDKQRGGIMKRDTCTTPWQNRADISVRQRFPGFMGQRLTAQLDIFNFMNLLNREWGQIRGATLSGFPQQAILSQTGRTAGPLNTSVPIVTFNQSVMNNTQPYNSYNGAFFRSQTTTSNFYSMQVTMRYSF
ncbi:MAG: TonB-dependent receptor [Gemmatimonadetes bacterium]|nr:TonB-dependent receptor [Gemmatimonadota bacterium]